MKTLLLIRAFWYRMIFYRTQQSYDTAHKTRADAIQELHRSEAMLAYEGVNLQKAIQNVNRTAYAVSRHQRIKELGI